MIPVHQTILGPHGNCLQACVASVLELPLDQVPHFYQDGAEDWQERLQHWCVDRCGLFPMIFRYDRQADYARHPGWVIAGGRTARGSHLHAVVYHDGRLAHDPFYGGPGLLEVVDLMVFVALNPAAAKRGGDR